jgi:hypothetical protein
MSAPGTKRTYPAAKANGVVIHKLLFCRPALGTKAKLGSYSCMSSKVDLYLVHGKECCLTAVRGEDNNRPIHWLEAATRWVALGRRRGAVATTSDSATAKHYDAVKSLPVDLTNRRFCG